MHGLSKNSLRKKSIYLAVVLAVQGGVTIAEEAAPLIEVPAPETKVEELDEVAVKSKIVEPKDGYQATKTRVGKTLQDPHDVPQAVTTVTNQLMQDQQVGSLREALRNVSGLTFNAAEG